MWRDLKAFWKISRPVNILISVLTFALACFLTTGDPWGFWLDPPFWATAFTIGIIAATGYWINDVYDFRIDRINRPNKTIVNAILSVKKVLTFYFIFTAGILLFSIGYLGFYLQRYHISFINILSVLLLFLYASYLKRVGGVAGNLTISFLIALVLILAYYLYDDLTLSLFWATIFAFEITLIREITKDVEDIRGDLEYRLRTLPIQVGVRSTKRILGVLYVVFMVSVYMPFFIPFPNEPQAINWPYLLVSLLLVQGPAIYLIIKLQGASKPLEFGEMSRWLKYLMLGGMLTLFWL